MKQDSKLVNKSTSAESKSVRGNSLGFLQMHVLWILSKQPMHAYSIIDKIAKQGKKIEESTIYPTLQKLEDAGHIRISANGSRGKKIYSVTSAGRKTMLSACKDFANVFADIFRDFVCTSCKGACGKCSDAPEVKA